MQQMMGGQGKPPGMAPGGAQPPGAAPGGAAAPPGGAQAGPAAAPMSTPQKKKGLQAAAATNCHIAVNMLEEALPAFGSESPEGQKILKALQSLSSLVGQRDTSDLVPAEILQMVRRMPQMGGGTGVQQAVLKQMQGQQPPSPSA